MFVEKIKATEPVLWLNPLYEKVSVASVLALNVSDIDDAEPTHSPCMLVGMMSGLHDKTSVRDYGLDNLTAADGLAVGQASGFIGKMMEPALSGLYTLSDDDLFELLALLRILKT